MCCKAQGFNAALCKLFNLAVTACYNQTVNITSSAVWIHGLKQIILSVVRNKRDSHV